MYELEELDPVVAAQVDALSRRAWDDYEAALEFVLRRPWDERLRHAAALGAATAATAVAGEFRQQDYLDALPAVAVEEVR